MSESSIYTYELDINDDEIIRASSLYDESIVSEIAELFECDEDDAECLLDASMSEWDFECDEEKSWRLQGLRAECAKKMGFLACEDEDENGDVWMIKMDDEILSKMKLVG
jgi:hypothetical protein